MNALVAELELKGPKSSLAFSCALEHGDGHFLNHNATVLSVLPGVLSTRDELRYQKSSMKVEAVARQTSAQPVTHPLAGCDPETASIRGDLGFQVFHLLPSPRTPSLHSFL